MSRAANPMCGDFAGSPSDSAASLIYRVAQSCGVNPQVIIVMLQKEQGLVTSSSPSPYAFNFAMGYNCPDTTGCTSDGLGFATQIYGGAYMLKRYANPPGTSQYFTWYAPGKTWNIRYSSTNASCGSPPVYVRNQATADLYYYTPYQPNAAALAAGYGVGDGCSEYGNRNFFNYFSDWFGAPVYEVSGSIADAWRAAGGSGGWVGPPAGAMVWNAANGGGWYQQFRNATIYVVRGGPTTILKTASLIRSTFESGGGVTGLMGWPIAEEACGAYGCSVTFQRGNLVWSNESLAVQPVVGLINAYWVAGGGVNNSLRAPSSPEAYSPGAGGWSQSFLGGTVYLKAGGEPHWLTAASAIHYAYRSGGGPSSALGWPTADETCGAVGCEVQLENGALVWDSGNGSIQPVTGALGNSWHADGGVNNPIGAPAAPMVALSGGWEQLFRNGRYYLKAGGSAVALKVQSALQDRYRALGGTVSGLGWPRSPEACGGYGCFIDFEGGYLSWDGKSGAIASMKDPIATLWKSAGGLNGQLGAPLVEQSKISANGDGAVQAFSNGYVYATPSGGAIYHKSSSALAAQYRMLGGPTGDLGWPTGEETCGDGRCILPFAAGTLVWNSMSGTITRQ